MSGLLPEGFRIAGVHCGMKLKREDVALIVTDEPAVAAGVYTQNQVVAAPVVIDRQRTPSDSIRAVVVNSGNANACTGEQGDRDALEMIRLTAESVGCDAEQVLVMSTGIIGKTLPMDMLSRGIANASEQLGTDDESIEAAARGILTTDLVTKIASRTIEIDGQPVVVTGIAKGSGMVRPNMATMLSTVMTDAALTPEQAQAMLSSAVEASFNCVSVDGHTSTNDTVLLLASGAAATVDASNQAAFARALGEVCVDLAKAVANDGEGATHLITVEVEGCGSVEDARKIAGAVADSPLVKTAVAGHDPNWGRIVSAAGYAGVPFDPAQVRLQLNGVLLYNQGCPVPFDAAVVSQSMQEQRDTLIQLRFAAGDAATRFWTCDLTTQYVHINADYHT